MHVPGVRTCVKGLAPGQVGVGVRNAAELVGMGVQHLVQASPADGGWAVLQLDFKNAFNCLDRTAMLAAVQKAAPCMYHWTRFSYCGDTPLYCQGKVLRSQSGVHQGDPLGQLCFALGIQDVVEQVKSLPLFWSGFYLDDGILVGPLETLAHAFSLVKRTF